MMVTSILVSIIYVYFNWKNKLFGRMMSITFMLITYGLFTSFCAAQGFFQYLPHIARTGVLALLVITPLLFLSLKRGLPNVKLKYQDWLHFVPALLYVVNFLPFFLLPTSEKLELITTSKFTTFDEGWILPKYFVLYMSLAQILLYLTLTAKEFFLPNLLKTSENKKSKRFIYVYFIYLSLLLFPPIGAIYSDYSGNDPASPVLLTYISSQLIFFLMLLSQPKLIYTSMGKESEQTKEAQKENLEPSLHRNQYELSHNPEVDPESNRIMRLIIDYFEKEKPYLRFEFDQKELSEKLNLSGYQIRTTLKNTYSISFSDFVNYHRIQFLLKMLDEDPRWRNYTMATLANSIGFKSTNSLYLASKKFIQTTPKEYIDLLNNVSQGVKS